MSQISFHRSLYSSDAVEAAATAYAEYAQITLERSGDEVVANVGDVTGDRATIENAFCTLALQETIVRFRRAAAPEEE